VVTGVPARVNLIAVAPGRVPSAMWRGNLQPGTTTRVKLALGGDGSHALLRFTWHGGTPAPADLAVLYRTGNQGWLGGRTDHDGTLDCEGLAPGQPLAVHVAACLSPKRGRLISVATDATIPAVVWGRGEATVEVQPAANLRFKLLDGEGGPLEGMQLRLIEAHRGEHARVLLRARGSTDAAGEWGPGTTRAIEVGDYALCELSGRVLWEGRASSAEQQPVRLVLAPMFRVVVRLCDWRGAPLRTRFISVALSPIDRGLDADITSLEPPHAIDFRDSAEVVLFGPRDESQSMCILVRELRVGARQVPLPPFGSDVLIQPSMSSGAASILIRDALQEPVVDAFVALTATEPGGLDAVYWARTDESGRAKIYGMRPGDYDWKVIADTLGSPVSSSTPVAVSRGDVAVVDIDVPW
jgi:Polysaccharide lyase family 4, domain II